MRIAIDAMGGDHAPAAVVEGAVAAAHRLQLGLDLVGRAADIRRLLDRCPRRPADVEIVDAPEVVEMGESPAAALRRKPDASIRVTVERAASGAAAAAFTAGHTGAAVMSAHAVFGMLSGVDRPALLTTIPTRRGPAVLLDSGANVGCRPAHLVQFAWMGSLYARVVFGLARPRVALLSIGEEETKGTELVREAHRLLKSSGLNFLGNLEARSLYNGDADVVVADGFTGNVALKVSEGLVETVEALLRDELRRTWRARAGSLLARPAFERFLRRVDYSESGGAPLLGVAGLLVVGHGRSSSKAVANGVALAARFAAQDLAGRLRQEIQTAAVVGSGT